jgi:hypothetical protein
MKTGARVTTRSRRRFDCVWPLCSGRPNGNLGRSAFDPKQPQFVAFRSWSGEGHGDEQVESVSFVVKPLGGIVEHFGRAKQSNW